MTPIDSIPIDIIPHIHRQHTSSSSQKVNDAANERANSENAPKKGGFFKLKIKASKAKKALQRIWKKVTGKR